MASTRGKASAPPHQCDDIKLPDLLAAEQSNSRELNIVFVSVGCTEPRIVDDILAQLAGIPEVSVRAVLDTRFSGTDFMRASATCRTIANRARSVGRGAAQDVEGEAAALCEWANLLVLAPIDATNLGKMLHGHTDNLLLELLRSWDVSKKILLVPGMSTLMWENPMTKKQLAKIRRKWKWIHLLQPILWTVQHDRKKVQSWDVQADILDTVRNQLDLKNIGQGVVISPSAQAFSGNHSKKSTNVLPPELWTNIFDFTGDWELAQTMHVYTNLPTPVDWQDHTRLQGPDRYMKALELTILKGSLADVKRFISTHGVPRWLSKLCTKLIMRFAMTPLLSHLEANHKGLFWATFGHAFLPDKASSVFGRTEVLEFWRTSPSFLTKEYNAEAIDGASRAGFVNVLEWWQQSGLPLRFTEAAMESASSQGHLSVLKWWKAQSSVTDDDVASRPHHPSRVRLKPGKSICYATQNGHTEVVRWWERSGIAFPHEDTVARLASTHGHVDILQLWYELKGSKMIFDNQVLVGATKTGYVRVLEWWKRSGLKVEYKTCDVEEALEDGDEGERGTEVRRWWARNGLNLGVGTSEWMKTKVLNS